MPSQDHEFKNLTEDDRELIGKFIDLRTGVSLGIKDIARLVGIVCRLDAELSEAKFNYEHECKMREQDFKEAQND